MKLLVLDIETAPHEAYVWGLRDQNISINQIAKPGYTLCYAAKYQGKRGVLFDSIKQSGALGMAKSIHKLLSESDAVISFNGLSFDLPTLNKEFVLHGMAPPPPLKHIDLYRTCRSKFRFASNKLDFVSQALGLGAKVQHKGQSLWTACMHPKHPEHEAAWRMMERYNRGDVLLTERLYDRLLPWIPNHPNHSLYSNTNGIRCPKCDSQNMQARGFSRTAVARFRRYQCQDCGGWAQARTQDKEVPQPDLKPAA